MKTTNMYKLVFSCTSGARCNVQLQGADMQSTPHNNLHVGSTFSYFWAPSRSGFIYRHSCGFQEGVGVMLYLAACMETRSLPLLCCRCAIYFHAKARIDGIVTPKKMGGVWQFIKGRWLLNHLRPMLSHNKCLNRIKDEDRFLHHLFYIRSKEESLLLRGKT